MAPDVGLFILRVVTGLIIAAHGAQKVFGWWGGPGLRNWSNAIAQMGFRPPGLWAVVSAYAELLGGLALVLGLLTPLAAAVLVIDMVVATAKVHWKNGLWAEKGGYEYTLALFVAFAILGLTGGGALALDATLGISAVSMPLFLVATGTALIFTAAAMQQQVAEEAEERRRRAA